MTTRGFPLAEWCLILAKKDNSLPCATLFSDFSESKSGKILFVWLSVACFGRKREIFFKVQLCTDAFLRRKAVEKSPTRINRSRDYSPLDNPPTGGFHSKECKCPKLRFLRLNYPHKRDRTAITVRPCNLRQNRRATGARMGLVSK